MGKSNVLGVPFADMLYYLIPGITLSSGIICILFYNNFLGDWNNILNLINKNTFSDDLGILPRLVTTVLSSGFLTTFFIVISLIISYGLGNIVHFFSRDIISYIIKVFFIHPGFFILGGQRKRSLTYIIMKFCLPLSNFRCYNSKELQPFLNRYGLNELYNNVFPYEDKSKIKSNSHITKFLLYCRILCKKDCNEWYSIIGRWDAIASVRRNLVVVILLLLILQFILNYSLTCLLISLSVMIFYLLFNKIHDLSYYYSHVISCLIAYQHS